MSYQKEEPTPWRGRGSSRKAKEKRTKTKFGGKSERVGLDKKQCMSEITKRNEVAGFVSDRCEKRLFPFDGPGSRLTSVSAFTTYSRPARAPMHGGNLLARSFSDNTPASMNKTFFSRYYDILVEGNRKWVSAYMYAAERRPIKTKNFRLAPTDLFRKKLQTS